MVNFPLGKIFLGDGGAYFAGFLLAGLGVLLPMRNPETSAWTAILICAYPVIETLASMRRKARRDGHSVGQPDRVHFHMLAHRRYARRIVRAPRARPPAQPGDERRHLAAAAADRASSRPSPTTACSASAFFFFVTVFIYGQLYRVMSLNAPEPAAGARPAALTAGEKPGANYKTVDAAAPTTVSSVTRRPA